MNASLTLAAISLAAASGDSKVDLIVESNNYHFAGKSLRNIHFGAGMNGCLLSDYTESYYLNSTSQTIYENIQISDGVSPYYLRPELNDLVFAAGSDNTDAVVQNGYSVFNGSRDHFYLCKTLAWDPYGYTKDPNTYGFAVYENTPAEGCEPIRIKVDVSY